MDVSASSKATAGVKQVRINEEKWTKPLMEAGWTAVPTVLIERMTALGLQPLDLVILLHLASYWWTADNKPHPSKKTIAAAIGVDPRTVQRRIAEMEKDGLIRREEQRISGRGSKPNLYHFDGLITAATPYAKEKLEERKRRMEENEARVRRKRPKLVAVD